MCVSYMILQTILTESQKTRLPVNAGIPLAYNSAAPLVGGTGKDAMAVGDNILGGAPLMAGVGVPGGGGKVPSTDYYLHQVNLLS